jgi:CRISPR-associated exonuclease Cas4
MTLDNIPDFADNTNKCEKCSTVQYCLPEETKMLEKDDAKKVRRERNEQGQ